MQYVNANSQTTGEDAPTPDDGMECVIVLVHGTFAPGASWTQDGSLFRKRISELLKTKKVRFERFDWTGRWPGPLKKINNSHTIRLSSAGRLQAKLREIGQAYPNARIFLVGHSHGGNVALYALKDDEIACRVSGVITLSTPFITCVPRPVTWGMYLGLLSFAGFCLWGLLIMFLLSPDIEDIGKMHEWEPGAITFTAILVITPIVLTSMFFKLWRVLRRGRYREARTAQIIKDLSLPNVHADQLFYAYSNWDEAAILLRVIQTLSSWLHRLWTWKAQLILFGIACFFGPSYLDYLLRTGEPDWVTLRATPFWELVQQANWIEILLVGLCLNFVLWLLLLALTVAVPYFIRVYVYGGESWSHNLLTDIGIVQVPPTAGTREAYAAPGRGLVHGRLYAFDTCIVDIADWINQKLDSDSLTEQRTTL